MKNTQADCIVFSWTAKTARLVFEDIIADVNIALPFAKLSGAWKAHRTDGIEESETFLRIEQGLVTASHPEDNSINLCKSNIENIRTTAFVMPYYINSGPLRDAWFTIVFGVTQVSAALFRRITRRTSLKGISALQEDDLDNLRADLMYLTKYPDTVEIIQRGTEIADTSGGPTSEEPTDVKKVFNKMETSLKEILQAPSEQRILASWERPKKKSFRNTALKSRIKREKVPVRYGEEVKYFTIGVTISGVYWAKMEEQTAPHWIYHK